MGSVTEVTSFKQLGTSHQDQLYSVGHETCSRTLWHWLQREEHREAQALAPVQRRACTWVSG